MDKRPKIILLRLETNKKKVEKRNGAKRNGGNNESKEDVT